MVITVCNFKGGVGKTSTCHALSTIKGMNGNKVLVIDLDGQHSLTTSCGIDVKTFNNNTTTICDLFMAELSNVEYDINDILESIIHLKNIDIIPSTKMLSFCDRELSKKNKVNVLENILRKIKDKYDYIFLDCSPTRNNICENALLSSDSVIVPVESYYLGSEGLYDFIELLNDMNTKFNKNIYIEGIILTMFQNTNLCKTIKDYIVDAISGKNKQNTIKDSVGKEIKVFNETIPRSIKVAEASLYGKSIVEYLPNNPVSKQYIKIAEQIKNVKR